MSEFKKIDDTLDNAELVSTKTDGTKFDFNRFSLPLKFIEEIYNRKITLNEAIDNQTELRILINNLNNDYSPRITKSKREKRSFRICKRIVWCERLNYLSFWKRNKDNAFKTKEKESEENKLEKIKDDYKTFLEHIEDESKSISYELFKKHFNFVSSVFTKQLYKIKDKKENNELVNVIKSGIIDLKDEIKKMSKEEIENEKPDKILKVVEEILKFKKQKQQGLGLKILTPNQMLSRLPITLAQLKAGNNFEKLKNEIRQLLYSLYRSKKLKKQLYKSLLDII